MRQASLPIVLVTLAALGSPCQAQISDNFSDLNDTVNPMWTHLNGWVNSTGQTWNASTGQYRMTAPNNGAQALGFVGSYVQPIFTDSTVSADIVSFVDGFAQGAVFGVAARLNGLNGVGQLTGYAFVYEPFAAGGAGEVVLYRINPGVSTTDLGFQQVTLDPAKDYRFVLEIEGTQLHGQVFEIGAGLVAEKFATSATYGSGYSGLFAYSQSFIPPVDVTWDNFSVNAICPADLNNDDTVNVDDLLAIINAWGTSGTADITLDGIVNVDDLLMVINAWGPCP